MRSIEHSGETLISMPTYSSPALIFLAPYDDVVDVRRDAIASGDPAPIADTDADAPLRSASPPPIAATIASAAAASPPPSLRASSRMQSRSSSVRSWSPAWIAA